MKIGVFTALFRDRSFEEMCKYLNSLGVDAVELACGGTTGKHHTDPLTIMDQPEKIKEMKDTLAKYNLSISAVSCHGNPVHPNKEIAKEYQSKALPHLEKALTIKPNDLQVLQILKELYYKTGKFEESQQMGARIKELTE